MKLLESVWVENDTSDVLILLSTRAERVTNHKTRDLREEIRDLSVHRMNWLHSYLW